jgi:hypothetical protein
MLHFFRHIRRSFFLPGKVRTYLAYAFGEIVLIVVGILIALQISDWNEERKERIEEKMILTRLAGELEGNLSRSMSITFPILDAKREALDQVERVFNGAPVVDASAFLTTVAASTDMGWITPTSQRNIFEEIISSGRFMLIQNSELRDKISNFYSVTELMNDAMTARIGDYPKLAYKLIPRSDEGEGEPMEGMSAEDEIALVAAVFNSDLKELIVSELNRTKYLKEGIII